MTVAAIHQPTFLPYLGWWDKLARADVMVILDDVQFPKKGGTWMNRVRMLVNGRAAWVTVPLDRTYHGTRSIRETLIDDAQPWRQRIVRTIAESYKRAAAFGEVHPVVEELLAPPTSLLAELNERVIRDLALRIGFDVGKLVRQSDLGSFHATGSELLIEIVRAVGADVYLTGDGAGGYLESEQFAAAGIELREQRFSSPRYPQLRPDFVAGLSVVDALMSVGFDGVAELVRSAPGGGSTSA